MDFRETFDSVFALNSTASQTARRHAKENYDRAIEEVQLQERKMGIEVSWTYESDEWNEAAELVAKKRYLLCINKLEQLVLKRMFELTKMNMSKTGRFLQWLNCLANY